MPGQQQSPPACDCNREELRTLLGKCRANRQQFVDHFFQGKANLPALLKLAPHDLRGVLVEGDMEVRHRGCGKTIDEHPRKRAREEGWGSVEELPSHDLLTEFIDLVEKIPLTGGKETSNYQMLTISKLDTIVSKLAYDDGEYYAPNKVLRTWAENQWKANLEAGRNNLTGLDPLGTNSRGPRVMGLHSGTGTGKTHALLGAPGLLGATISVYITYNLGQVLSFDKKQPRIAILLRVLLRMMGKSNTDCSIFFSGHGDMLASLDEGNLRNLLVSYAAARATPLLPNPIVVCVDEMRKLMGNTDDNSVVMNTTSALGQLACELQKIPNVTGTVLVSALTESTFTTKSERPVEEVKLPPPSTKSRDFVVAQLMPDANAHQKVMIAAAAGNHFRSVVVACAALQAVTQNQDMQIQGQTLSVSAIEIASEILKRLSMQFTRSERNAIIKYVKLCVSQSLDVVDVPEAMQFVDGYGAVPPTLVICSFGLIANDPVQNFFVVSSFVNATKQLEHCGYEYDRFRAEYGLPVVPCGVEVHDLTGKVHGFKWPDLRFCFEGSSTSSIFETVAKSVRRTTYTPSLAAYVFPGCENHPWIDRACLVKDPVTGKMCMVIYQDKINQKSFAEAVHKLNEAAKTLGAQMNVTVLCVAHVIGATDKTKAQSEFKHPYILIRDAEVEAFYTPSFAPAIQYVRDRHVFPGTTQI